MTDKITNDPPAESEAPTASKAGFFSWCEAQGIEPKHVWKEFRVSSQTIRNWRRKDDGDPLPSWIPLACLAVEELRAGRLQPGDMPDASAAGLSAWQASHGFRTYKDTADIFAIKRQAVHNWFKRQKFPRWLPLACAGYDLKHGTAANKDSSDA